MLIGRRASIGTAVETQASGSKLIPGEVRRMSSEAENSEIGTGLWQESRPLQLEKIVTDDPQVPEMTIEVAGG